jgi:hypothetical protein
MVPRTVFGNLNAPHPSIVNAINVEDNPCFKYESKCETDKAEGFADDTSVATLFDYDSLAALKKSWLTLLFFPVLNVTWKKHQSCK